MDCRLWELCFNLVIVVQKLSLTLECYLKFRPNQVLIKYVWTPV